MSALPTGVYANKSRPLWMPFDETLAVSTITASGALGLDPSSGAIWGVTDGSLIGVPSSIYQIQGVPGPYVNIFSLRQNDVSGQPLQSLIIGQNSNDTSQTVLSHTTKGVTDGQIRFVSSLNGNLGGVVITAQDGTSFNVAKEGTNLTDGTSGQVITTVFDSISTARIQYKPDGALTAPTSEIQFFKETSTIQLVSGSSAIGVRPSGAFTTPASCQKTLAPVAPSVIIASNATETPLISYSNLQPNNFYRVGFTASFQNTTNNPANSNDFLQLYAYGQGSPNDGEDIATINNSWMVTSSNTPGLLGGANGFYSCTFTPFTSNWVVYAAPSPNQQNNVQINMDFVYLEKML